LIYAHLFEGCRPEDKSRAATGILVTGFQTSDAYKFKFIRVAMGRRFPEIICDLKL